MPWEEKNEKDAKRMAQDPWGDEPSSNSGSRKPSRLDDYRNRPRNGGGGGQGGGNGGGPRRPSNDLDDIIGSVSDGAGRIFKQLGSGGVGFVVVVLLMLYMATGIFQVGETERVVKTTFGRVAGVAEPGLNWHFPAPVGSRIKVDVSQQTLNIGGGTGQDELLIVTGDKQLVSFPIKVVWQVDPSTADTYTFAYRDPQSVIALAAETALRDNIGKTNALDAIGVLADQIRVQIGADLTALVSANDQPLGVRILRVDANGAPQVPGTVQESVAEIQQAQATAEKTLNEAQQFENRIVNTADGEAGRLLAQARQDVVSRINSGLGEANRLRQIYNGYRLSPESTLERLYEDARRILLKEANIDATAEELRLDQILNSTFGGSN